MKSERRIHGLIFPVCSFFILSALFFSDHFLAYRHVDDAYIYLQVVRNIVTGHGWMYNVGEGGLNPCSSISFVLFLVPVYVLVENVSQIIGAIDISMSLAVVEVISSTTIATVTWFALKHLPLSLRTCFSLTLAFQSLFIRTSGMESSFFIAVLCLTCFLYCRKYYLLTGIMLCVSGLTRTEGYALTLLVFALHWYDNRSISTRMLSGFIVPTILWYVFAILYFGEYLPHSTRIKVLLAGDAESQYRVGREFFLAFIHQPKNSVITAILAILGLCQFLNYWKERQAYLLLLFGLGLAQLLVYTYKGAIASYFWYFVPANVAASIVCVAGLHFLVQQFYVWSKRKEIVAIYNGTKKINSAAGILLGILFTAFISFYGIRPYEPGKVYRLSQDYTAIGEWIKANSEPGQKIAALEIGYIGFYSERPVVDMMGLVDKSAVEPLKKGELDWWYERRPQLIVKFPVPFSSLGYRDEYVKDFAANYALLKTQGSFEIWGLKEKGID